MVERMIAADLVEAENAAVLATHRADFEALGGVLDRRGVDIKALVAAAGGYGVALPSWGTGTGGTRFARYPGPGEPRGIEDKLDDCAVVHQLTACAPRVSLHIPWDKPKDPAALRAYAQARGLGFDAMNSNTFQDSPGQALSYKFGSLSHTDPAARAQAVAHNIDCIEIGESLGAKALSIWIGDGSNFPGQANFRRAFERYLEATAQVYAALPEDWLLFVEHKIHEPAFYSTVIQDWGSSYLAAVTLGPKARCLVDLGHHAPNVNIEMIVSRLVQFGKLAGFHFNDSKYGDDDLDSGAINPYQLFLIFNELVQAGREDPAFNPAYMLDQSHNVTDPIESLMGSAIETQRAYVQAVMVDRDALEAAQEANDALAAGEALKVAYRTDVSPILAEARLRAGGALRPMAAYRASGYRARVAGERPAVSGGGGGIV